MNRATHALRDANVRIEAMWPIPMAAAPDALCEAFEGAATHLPEQIRDMISTWSDDEKNDLLGGDYHTFGEAWLSLCWQFMAHNKCGYVAQVSTPVYHDGGCYSWGHYQTILSYADTADGLLIAAADWADAVWEEVQGDAA